MEIKNRTPLIAGWTVLLDKEGAEHLGVAVRGVWSIDERGRLAIVAEPPPLLPVDDCVGEPGLSSIRYEADCGPVKPATDCALIGSAVAAKGRASKIPVLFRVGKVAKRAVALGERKRLFWLLRWWNSPAKAAQRVPLQWELAAGGTDTTPKNEKQHSINLKNPYGRGFRARGSAMKRRGSLLPQIVTPGGCMPFGRSREPAGFGLTGNQWAHRKKYAGTYDDAWRKERCPLLPDDFDERFHSAASPGLVTEEHLVGGEPVEIEGATRGGKLAFKLPRVSPQVTATLQGEPEPVPMKLVTVTVDTDAMQLRLLWRGSLRVHGRLPRFKQLDVAAEGLGA